GHARASDPGAGSARVGTARFALFAAAFTTVWLAIAAVGDPLQLFLWAVTLSASTSFPVLFLTIWWKRINALGAISGMSTGFASSALVILLSDTGAIA